MRVRSVHTSWWTVTLFLIVINFALGDEMTGEQDEVGGLKFCHEGRLYKVLTSQCPGGILLKSAFKNLPNCICANGVFLHKSSDSDKPFDGIIQNYNYQCSEYKMTKFSQSNLFVPLTLPQSPFDETVTIIPYETETEGRLDLFLQRRYRIKDVMDKEASPVSEVLSREKIFYVGARDPKMERTTQSKVQIENLCLEKKFHSGVYVTDFEPSLHEHHNVTHKVGSDCAETAIKISMSEPEKIYHYSQYVRNECSIPKTCITTPETNLERPNLTLPSMELDMMDSDDDLQRVSRQANSCNELIEETVQLAEYLTRLRQGQILPYESDSTHLKILEGAVDIFKTIITNKVVPHEFIDQIFKYFHYLYFDLVEKEEKPNQDNRFTSDLRYALSQCKLNAREFNFWVTGCPAKVDFYKKYYAFDTFTTASPTLTEDQQFADEKYDTIPEAMWKVVNLVYNSCDKYFDVRISQREYFKVEMQKLFMLGRLQNRWRRNCGHINKVMQYKSILPYGDLNLIMQNLDVAVATSMIGAPQLNWIERPQKKVHFRKKRNIVNYEAYEIWDNALCFQMSTYEGLSSK